jgi:hypothetical protein
MASLGDSPTKPHSANQSLSETGADPEPTVVNTPRGSVADVRASGSNEKAAEAGEDVDVKEGPVAPTKPSGAFDDSDGKRYLTGSRLFFAFT